MRQPDTHIACTPKPPPEGPPATTPTEPAPRPEGGVISLETRDDVTLEADYYPAPEADAPAVVLIHMIPPSYDRSSWPADFIEALADEGWSLIALDRRGAGGSEGKAREAYEGEYGRYDVEAAALLLEEDDAGPLAVIGASNGTTSAVDYAVFAEGEDAPVPAAVVLMTGDTYTETQTDMDDYAELEIPTAFTFSTAERRWSLVQERGSPDSWVFLEYPDGDHGTDMFAAAPEVTDDILDFLKDVF